MKTKLKSKTVAYVLWLVGGFGTLGWHRFYLGKIGTGFLWFISLGGGLIGTAVDVFTLGQQVETYNTQVELNTIRVSAAANAKKQLEGDQTNMLAAQDQNKPE